MSDIFWGIIRAIIGIIIIAAMFWFDKTVFKPTKKKNGKMTKPFHKRWWTWTIAVALIVGGIGGALNPSPDDDQEASEPTTKKVHHKHKKSKSEKEFEKKMDKMAEKQSKEEKKKPHKDIGFVPSKKSQSKKTSEKSSKGTSKKENAEMLATALHALPKKTHGEIMSARITDDHLGIKIVLSDDLVDGLSDAALRKSTKQAWQIGTNYAYNFGPYPDGYFERDACPVYVLDSAGDELGESTMFGNFKWKG